jgi:PTS system ascorbate-specific IIA component
MPVKILLLTHKEVGEAMIDAAKNTLVNLSLACDTISVHHDTDFNVLVDRLASTVNETASEGGVLILTDLYGSTPCNIAKKICENSACEVVTGLNLAMLIRIMNYDSLPLNELAKIACEGGKQSIRQIRKQAHD